MGEATSPMHAIPTPTPPILSRLASPGLRLGDQSTMVGPVKSNTRGGGGGGGRPYGFMLLLAVGTACLGFMVLHKLREGRVLSLLVQEKDHELLSLHFLLQRERELNKETRQKLEEAKTSLFSLKAQKMDVEGRLVEVDSLISSLKDEQKIIESQLEEKRVEISTLKRQQITQREASELPTTDENDAVQPNSLSEPPPMNATAAVDGKRKHLGSENADKDVKHKKRKWRHLIRRFGEGNVNKGKDEHVVENVTLAGGGNSRFNETEKMVRDLGDVKEKVENGMEDQVAVENTGVDGKVDESENVDARENGRLGEDNRMVKDK